MYSVVVRINLWYGSTNILVVLLHYILLHYMLGATPDIYSIKTSLHRNAFRITGLCEGNPPMAGGSHKRPVKSELSCFHCHSLQQAAEHTIELPVIWDTMTSLWRQGNATYHQICTLFGAVLIIHISNPGGFSTCTFIIVALHQWQWSSPEGCG